MNFFLNLKFRSKSAFTLVEVLITLGIVGVIAAITIPQLIQEYKKHQTIARFKQMYSMVDQALLAISNDGIDLLSEDWINDRDKVADILSKYFKVTKRYTSADAWAGFAVKGTDPSFCIDYKNPVGFPKQHKDLGYRATWQNKMVGSSGMIRGVPSFVLLNGACVAVGQNEWTQKVIIVDLNGNPNGPNRIGHDTFYFYPNSKGRLGLGVPNGIDITKECSSTHFNDSYGRYCAARIIKEGYKINYW